MDITAKTTLRELLRERPAAVPILEAVAGDRCWRRLDETLADFLAEEGADEAPVLTRLRAMVMESTSAEQDWRLAPMYLVLDRLLESHRNFRERSFPNLLAMTTPERGCSAEESAFLNNAAREIRDFQADFLPHMEEEETYLFPKVLRTEACLNHSDLMPEIFTGSVAAYPPSLLQSPEERVMEMLSDLRKRVAEAGGPAVQALAERLGTALEAFETDLHDHARLEMEILIPRAREMEAALTRRLQR